MNVIDTELPMLQAIAFIDDLAAKLLLDDDEQAAVLQTLIRRNPHAVTGLMCQVRLDQLLHKSVYVTSQD